MDYLDLSTVMSAVEGVTGTGASYCGYSTDIYFYEFNGLLDANGYGNPRGSSVCIVWANRNGQICDRAEVDIFPSVIFVANGGFNGSSAQFDLNLHKTIRHEVGHTVGLDHYAQNPPTVPASAMVSGAVPYDFSYTKYIGHEICHINKYFGGAAC